jgi:hypothetical protein
MNRIIQSAYSIVVLFSTTDDKQSGVTTALLREQYRVGNRAWQLAKSFPARLYIIKVKYQHVGRNLPCGFTTCYIYMAVYHYCRRVSQGKE